MLGDIAISKIVNLIPTDMNQSLKIKFSEKIVSNIIFSENCRKFDEKHFSKKIRKKI